MLETTGRRSGRPRQTPVGNGLVDGTFWIVSSHGRQAGRLMQTEPLNLRIDLDQPRGYGPSSHNSR